MNLEFGILWIDDNQSEEEIRTLKEKLSEFGFVPYIEFLEKFDRKEITYFSLNNNYYYNIDLILLDYKLGDNTYGDKVAPSIRELFPNTTILFYSSCEEEKELRQKIADQKVDGVYCSRRIDLMAKASSLIEQTVHSLNRLSGMRGFAIKVVADCDELIKKSILQLCETFPICRDAVTELDDDVLSFFQEAVQNYNDVQKKGIEERFQSHLIDSMKSFKHLRRLTGTILNNKEINIDGKIKEDIKYLRNNTKKYDKDVLCKRNLFAHVKEVKTKNGLELVQEKFQKENGYKSGAKTSEGNLTPADYPDIRQTFATYFTNFREMAKLIETLCDNYK